MKTVCFLVLMLASALAANACTLCHSKTATAVRAAVFGSDMLSNIAVVLLPFAVCTLIVYGIYQSDFIFKQHRRHHE